MIAKCIALLAVVAQINASLCGCGSSTIVLPSQSSGLVSSGFSSGAVSKNLVANGKYPVALTNCGPVPSAQIPITTSHVTTPVQEKPVIRIPAQIPAPRTISHSCTCYKTIVRPRVHQQIITVPSVQRYVETVQKPVVENLQYEALPLNCGGVSSSGLGMISVGSSPVQTIQLPSLSASYVQPIELSSAQSVQLSTPCSQTVEIPQTISLGCGSPCNC